MYVAMINIYKIQLYHDPEDSSLIFYEFLMKVISYIAWKFDVFILKLLYHIIINFRIHVQVEILQ